MTMKLIFNLLILFILTQGILAAPPQAAIKPGRSGTVFLDRNGNGIRDRGERVLKGIPVSDGDTIVITDRKGRYTLPATAHSSIFPILPSGYEFPDGGICNTRFRYYPDSTTASNADFGLVRRRQPDCFSIAAVGDVQFGDTLEAGYASRTFFSELSARSDIAFSLFLGDLVNDDCTLFPLFRELADKLPMPSWTLPGNHDRDMDSVRAVIHYNSAFGADTYAFNYGSVHFIILNNVFTVGRRGYVGKLTEKQLRFLRNDLAWVPREKLVVIAQHIPMATVKNKNDVLALLDGRRCLLLSGHTHSVFRKRLSENVQELVAGAVCGLLWTGEQDLDLVPRSLQPCGTPRNYFRIDFDKTEYAFRFKGIGLDEAFQADVWIVDGNPQDREIEDLSSLPTGSVVVNLFAGGPETRVRMRIDNGAWQTLTHTIMAAPTVLRSRLRNQQGYLQSKYAHRSPHRNIPSPHIWAGQLPEATLPGPHRMILEARDTTADGAVKLIDSRVIFAP
ncbi:hypothetical protein B5E60_04175 [Alistipes sp. An116]|uniref:calcineurin-like phosphoesterase C-terminal domain-containing protein n=1 Tax=Alistipes sp. An116 TaxID=1965546 RepID=UPI000B3A84C7|nr:calcineurin-like phosphoesterase family protein [Alistipes sp. An116]OUQ54108.1 hypothetical protein B5E60_04175 [Alistipes sp. An116]